MLSVKFKAFRAIDEPELCERFIEGHRKVLEIYDIAMITSNKAAWTSHKNTYVILVESLQDGKALGGARVQVADDELQLPIVEAVGKVDKTIHDVINRHKDNITGEVCGLWNSREIAGYGIGSIFLTRAVIAVAYHRRVHSLFALCAPATVAVAKRAGFVIEHSLGNDGFFNYPKIQLVATAMFIKDLMELKNARPNDRQQIHDLIAKQNQAREEIGPKGKIHIDYQLELTCDPDGR